MANIRDKEWLKTGADGLTFGERLGDLISAAGINQAQLEKETGIKQSSISEYINGRKGGIKDRAPDCATIIALANYFSVSTDYLLGQTKITTQNADIKAICTYTGLSENSVNSILSETAEEETRLALEVILCSDGEKFHDLLTTVYRVLDGYLPSSNMDRMAEYLKGQISIETAEVLRRWYGTFLDSKAAMRYNSVEAGKILSDILDNSEEIARKKYQEVFGQIALEDKYYGID